MPIIFIFIVFLPLFAHSMESPSSGFITKISNLFSSKSEQPHKQITKGPCYLLALPKDIQNLILEYIEAESDDECIARTKNLSQGDENCKLETPKIKLELNVVWVIPVSLLYKTMALSAYNKSIKETQEISRHETPRSTHHTLLFSRSQSGKKIQTHHSIFLIDEFEVVHQSNRWRQKLSTNTTLSILDTYDFKTDTNESRVSTTNDNNKKLLAIAISDNKKCLLTSDLASVYKTSDAYTLHLNSANISDGFISTSHPIHLSSIKSCAFNRQGTKVIVHSNEGTNQIFPLSHDHDTRCRIPKSLREYFKSRGICK